MKNNCIQCQINEWTKDGTLKIVRKVAMSVLVFTYYFLESHRMTDSERQLLMSKLRNDQVNPEKC